ncbi:Similar to Sterol uptake control protein 2; acc. no. Q12151 [Pyronema omphalodes CBS 100304]|uniref:Similar to Sterol uptake control protein 2 acc. no. Q12151 n=1 Tax=Pyronema omphalodes (strain CBS 100304) TaxID=1076935 RepID=U4KZW6_PYROM|nr:Similar to Sterol uptake control protein 2; acc. no. Q12151 [Pyronema omphalodes CBS 100304]
MAPRRSHKKSRDGCLKCKKRRIKCDEVHPRCGNCIKHAIECDFSLPPEERAVLSLRHKLRQSPDRSGASSSPSAGSPPLNLPSPSPSHLQPSPGPSHSLDPHNAHRSVANVTDPLLYAAEAKQTWAQNGLPPLSPALSSTSPFLASGQVALRPFQNAHQIQESLNLFDLSLMHQWSVSTSDTLSNNKSIQDLWRYQIPAQLAVHHPFLMHSLLAVSALHLHTTENKGNNYIEIAARHQEHAVRGMAACLAHISRENCDALVVSSCLVVIYSFVSSRNDGASGSIASWVPLIRGVHEILKQAWNWVTQGPLSPLIRQYELSSTNEGLDSETEEVLNNLYQLCHNRSLPGSEELSDTAISTAYFSAIVDLRKSFATVNNWEHIIGSIFVWPITVSDKFVELLVERRPRALIIFIHYCALFTIVEEFWWTKGSALFELRLCEMCLSDEWKDPWISWPKQRILKRDMERKVNVGQPPDGQGQR